MIVQSALTRTMFHGTSSKFLRSILKEGLVQKRERVWEEGHMASFEGVYLTVDIGKALKSAHDAVAKFGGNRLIVVCRVSVSHPYIDEDFVTSLFLTFGEDPKIVLCRIIFGVFSLKKFIMNNLKVADRFFFKPVYEAFLSNRRLFASFIVKYLAYEVSKKFEERRSKGEYYDIYCLRGYPKFLFVRDKKGDLVRDEDGYPLLKRSSAEWYTLYRKDLDKLTRLIGKYASHIKDDVFLSIRIPKVGFRGSNRIIGIFKEEVSEEERIFKPVYLAKGFDSYLSEFVNKLVDFYQGALPSKRKDEYKEMMDKLISDKLGYKFKS